MNSRAALLRLVALAFGACTIAVFWNLPAWAGWPLAEREDWLAGVQLAGPAIATGLSIVAAWHSLGRDRQAWSLIAAASCLYILGNVGYLVLSRMGMSTFPSPADGVFFAMAMLCGAAVWLYGNRSAAPLAVNTYNFVLLYGAMVFGTLFILHVQIRDSQLNEFATIVAFLYPALWGSVAALAIMLALLHPWSRRRIPLRILAAAVTAEALADFIYAAQLMGNSYQVGGTPHLLWMVSAALIAWSAVEHIVQLRQAEPEHAENPNRDTESLIGQALAPTLVLLVILLTGTVAGAFGRGVYQMIAVALTVVVTSTVGLREYTIEKTRRQLHKVAEDRLERLEEGEHRLTSVLESTSDSVVVLDLDWKIRFYNQRALHLVPEIADIGIGGDFWKVIHPSERESYGAQLQEVLRTREPWSAEAYSAPRSLWVDLRVYPMGDGVSLFFRDITEERRSREEIAYLAHRDFLTGLSSRSVFNKVLRDELPAGSTRTVLLIDLDFFKDINDTLGHSVGDAVLIEVARRVRDTSPAEALVARLGGDEFALVMQDVADDELARIGEALITALAVPILVESQSLVVKGSIGIATTRTPGDGADLFTRADIALYAAKASGRSQVLRFEPDMEVAVRDRKALLSDLSHAAENGELELAYQPLVDTALGRTTGFEALLRWRHPQRGLIAPDDFIPLAEESGLMTPIGEWVLRAACREATNWPQDISLSVNVSTQQLSDADFIAKIVGALHAAGLANHRLELEVTESALLREANLHALEQVNDLGIRVALDDFGTGYSSLSYLQRFHFSKLKIDRSFIARAPRDTKSTTIVETVLSLARNLGMQVTVEGVETAEQFDWVARHAALAQGFYLGRPMPAADVPAYLSTEATSPQRLSA